MLLPLLMPLLGGGCGGPPHDWLEREAGVCADVDGPCASADDEVADAEDSVRPRDE